ncbi:MAG TPA: phasin family protein [Casimicrobiaceae bacterium]|nr:phasin family protein [Casimicrobiaceae bacterium]
MATKTATKRSSTRKSSGAAKRSRAASNTTGAGQARSSASSGAPRDGGAARGNATASNPFAALSDPKQFAKLKQMMTPEQAFELYRQNARLALEIMDAAIESTAKMRKLQFEGEEEARGFHKRAAKRAAEAENPEALVATGQNLGQEALQKSMAYWSQMFDLIVEMQKRLFVIIENQVEDIPGVKQAKAAMGMLPDLSQTQNLVKAMQGVMTSGGSAFESMQRVMGDFTRMAQQSMPGMKRQ